MADTGCPHDRWRVEAVNTVGFGRCLVCKNEVLLSTLFNGLHERMKANAPTAARVLEAFSEKLLPSLELIRLDLSKVEGRVQRLEESMLCPTCEGTGRMKHA